MQYDNSIYILIIQYYGNYLFNISFIFVFQSEIASKNFDNNVGNSGDQLVSIPSTSIPDNSSQMLVDADIVNSSNHNASEEPILNSSQDKTSQPMEDVDIGKSSENVTAEIDIHYVPQTNVSAESSNLKQGRGEIKCTKI